MGQFAHLTTSNPGQIGIAILNVLLTKEQIVNMDKFFVFCGALLKHAIRTEGRFPKTRFISCFTYERGYAEFDGERWVFNKTMKVQPADNCFLA